MIGSSSQPTILRSFKRWKSDKWKNGWERVRTGEKSEVLIWSENKGLFYIVVVVIVVVDTVTHSSEVRPTLLVLPTRIVFSQFLSRELRGQTFVDESVQRPTVSVTFCFSLKSSEIFPHLWVLQTQQRAEENNTEVTPWRIPWNQTADQRAVQRSGGRDGCSNLTFK